MHPVRLWAHLDDVGSQRVAERAGPRRGHVETGHPVKNEAWDIVWYDLARPES
jgi:RimJ/RimL family protein N-acetyltransferase